VGVARKVFLNVEEKVMLSTGLLITPFMLCLFGNESQMVTRINT
jgi:hypothetical protein